MKNAKPKKAMREGHAVTTLLALSVRMESIMTYTCTSAHGGPQGQDRFVSTGQCARASRAGTCEHVMLSKVLQRLNLPPKKPMKDSQTPLANPSGLPGPSNS